MYSCGRKHDKCEYVNGKSITGETIPSSSFVQN